MLILQQPLPVLQFLVGRAFSSSSEALLIALTELNTSQHTLTSCCLVWKPGIPCNMPSHHVTGRRAGWLPLCSSKATLRVVARAKALMEPCIPPTTDKASLRQSWLQMRLSNLHYGHLLSSFSPSHIPGFLLCITIYSPITLSWPAVSPRLLDYGSKWCCIAAFYPPHSILLSFISSAFPHDLHEYLSWVQVASAITNKSSQYLFLGWNGRAKDATFIKA